MARQPRTDVGDYVYHVINRANSKACIFSSEKDYLDFEYLLNEMRETFDMRILAYVIMPNHWHLLLYPKKDGDMGRALHWLTTSHARRHLTPAGIIRARVRSVMDISIKDPTSHSWWRTMSTCWPFSNISNAIRCERSWQRRWKIGDGEVRIVE